jgi:hypothetical protein
MRMNSLSRPKLMLLERLTTEHILVTLMPGHKNCLKARTDGTVLDGHHRIHVLRLRVVDVNTLPREIVIKDDVD